MLSRILTKAIYDQKRSLIYWNLGTVLLVFLVMTMYPAVQEAGEPPADRLSPPAPEGEEGQGRGGRRAPELGRAGRQGGEDQSSS